MNALYASNSLPVDAVVARAVNRFGAFAVLRALVRQALWRGRLHAPPDVAGLSDHLRRDIGLPPQHGARQNRLDRPVPWLM